MKTKRSGKILLHVITSIFAIFHAVVSCAASADEVLVVVNKRMSGAKDIARYYMEKRNIPADHLVVTSTTLNEVMERDEFIDKLREPLRQKIKSLESETKIYGVVLIYGVPLKVLPPALDWDSEEKLQELKMERAELQKAEGENTSRLGILTNLITSLSGRDKRASVDSELMLAKVEEYNLAGWVANPYFVGFQADQHKKQGLRKDDVLLVSRLDGPDAETVYRLIDDALAAERKGLEGVAYFDARWPMPKNEKLTGYAQWDHSLHIASQVVKQRMEVQLDERDALFPPGSAPNAALYCGWYSLARYIDSFTWVQGAVGYHIASAECSTLRKQESQVWCMQMLKRGIAATIGPVYEPYVQGFPLPEVFFAALTGGYMNLGESYLISLPFISWQMILVGDPLYMPFAQIQTRPKVDTTN